MPSAPEAAELVEAYWPLALSIARRWASRFPVLAPDFESEAGYALWRAATSWPGDSAVEFGAWAARRVRWAILCRLRQERAKNPTAFQRVAVVTTEDGEPVDPASLIPAAGTPAEEQVALDELLATLPPARRAQVVRHVAGGETLAAIGAERGVSGGAVGQQVARDLGKLRRLAGV